MNFLMGNYILWLQVETQVSNSSFRDPVICFESQKGQSFRFLSFLLLSNETNDKLDSQFLFIIWVFLVD